jgi:hypothetical protein
MPFLSRTYFTNDGTTEDYQFDFPYLLPAHVLLLWRAEGTTEWTILNSSTEWEFTSSSIIHLLIPPLPDGSETVVRRQTPNEDLLDRLTAPSTLAVAELNLISTQLLYLIQEALDSGLSFEGNAIGDVLDDVLSLARYSYDISFSGINTASSGVRMGPFVLTRPLSVQASALGSQVAALPLPGSGEAVFAIEHNGVQVGTINVTSSGATLAWPSTVFFEPGDAVAVYCSQSADDNFNLGLTLRARREDT